MLEIPIIRRKAFNACYLCRGIRTIETLVVQCGDVQVPICWRHYRLLADGILLQAEFDKAVRCQSAAKLKAAARNGPPEEDIPF